MSKQLRHHLAEAQIENLGQIMERLVDGDEGLLAVEGIDQTALAEIKAQVEIMVSIPPEEPKAEVQVEEEVEERPETRPLPRYEYVADDELEQKSQPKRQRRKKPRRLIYDEELGEVVSHRREKSDALDEWDEWDALEE